MIELLNQFNFKPVYVVYDYTLKLRTVRNVLEDYYTASRSFVNTRKYRIAIRHEKQRCILIYLRKALINEIRRGFSVAFCVASKWQHFLSDSVYRFRVTCESAGHRSLSNKSRGLTGFNGVKGLRRIDTFNGVFVFQGPPQPGQPFKFSVGESCDRIKEEFNFLQAQYHRYPSSFRIYKLSSSLIAVNRRCTNFTRYEHDQFVTSVSW